MLRSTTAARCLRYPSAGADRTRDIPCRTSSPRFAARDEATDARRRRERGRRRLLSVTRLRGVRDRAARLPGTHVVGGTLGAPRAPVARRDFARGRPCCTVTAGALSGRAAPPPLARGAGVANRRPARLGEDVRRGIRRPRGAPRLQAGHPRRAAPPIREAAGLRGLPARALISGRTRRRVSRARAPCPRRRPL